MAGTRTIHERNLRKDAKDMIDLALLAVDHEGWKAGGESE
jgi:hypothetical protein